MQSPQRPLAPLRDYQCNCESRDAQPNQFNIGPSAQVTRTYRKPRRDHRLRSTHECKRNKEVP